jgi:hypothetical protein
LATGRSTANRPTKPTLKRTATYRRVDKSGREVRVGDRIRVTGIPPDVRNYKEDPADEEKMETKTVFERCLGRKFRIEDFDDDRVELLVGRVMGRPRYEHSIWLEPQFIELVKRSPKKPRRRRGMQRKK